MKHVIAIVATATASIGFAHAQQGLQSNIKFGKIEDMDKCAQQYRYDTGVCMEPLENFAKGKSSAQLFEIGKRSRLHFTHWAALRFFEPALGKSPTPAQCSDEDVALAVISGLALPPDHAHKPRADRIFAGPCFAALRPAVEKELATKSSSYYTQATCAVLASKSVKNAACEPKAPEVAVAPPAPPPIPKVDLKTAPLGLAKVYVGPEGERVAVVDVPGQQGAYVVRFSGLRSKINDKTYVHLEMPSSNGADYVAENDGTRWNTLTQRGSGWSLYAPGVRDTIRLVYSDRDTKTFDKESLRR